MKKNISKTIEGLITELSKKGHGICRLQQAGKKDLLIDVPYTLPGDQARFTLRGKKKGTYYSSLEGVIIPSIDRIPPRCIHFGTCGGCRLQHYPYDKQLEFKDHIVREYLSPWINEHVSISPIIGCSPPWEYRNKMEFSFSQDASGKPFLGLIKEGSRGKILDLQVCHLVTSWFIEALKITKQWWLESGLKAYHFPSNQGSLRTLTLREGQKSGDRMVVLTVSGNSQFALQKNHIESFVAFLKSSALPSLPDSDLSIFLRIQQAIKGTPTQFFEIHLDGPPHIRETLLISAQKDLAPRKVHFLISPSAFFQPNPRQAEKLYSSALQMIKLPQNGVVYDLYCGTGTLGICAAPYVRKVIGVELSPEAALDAQSNISGNKIDNMSILNGSTADVIKKIREDQSFPLPDVVMVDPPRSGLDKETIQHLLELLPSQILYISCNPETQAENLQLLCAQKYSLESIQTVDQFPHTPHIENIIVLRRSG